MYVSIDLSMTSADTHTPIHVYTFRARTPFVSRPGNSASHFTPEPLLIHRLTNDLLYIVLSLLLTDRATGRTPIHLHSGYPSFLTTDVNDPPRHQAHNGIR